MTDHVALCGYRYRMSERYSPLTPDWCGVCVRFHSRASRCPRCAEWSCEACAFARAA